MASQQLNRGQAVSGTVSNLGAVTLRVVAELLAFEISYVTRRRVFLNSILEESHPLRVLPNVCRPDLIQSRCHSCI